MREAQWKDYELIDCSCGERLERWGDIILIRPDPQVIFNTEKNKSALATGTRKIPPLKYWRWCVANLQAYSKAMGD